MTLTVKEQLAELVRLGVMPPDNGYGTTVEHCYGQLLEMYRSGDHDARGIVIGIEVAQQAAEIKAEQGAIALQIIADLEGISVDNLLYDATQEGIRKAYAHQQEMDAIEAEAEQEEN